MNSTDPQRAALDKAQAEIQYLRGELHSAKQKLMRARAGQVGTPASDGAIERLKLELQALGLNFIAEWRGAMQRAESGEKLPDE